ncbi:g9073 [Coccomyxa elongata]
MGICRSKHKDFAEPSLYEEKQREAAKHEGRHLPPEPTPAWVDPGTVSRTTGSPALADACIVFVLGGPGSGKGTQCDMIVKKYGFVHLSAGDLLREEVKKGTELGKEIEGIMKEGKLVPTDITVKLLREAMEKSTADTFLIDGFPREIHQAQVFERKVKPPQLVIYYDCPEDVMKERLLKRAQTSGRADDNEETITKRFKTFLECTIPVVEYYERKGLLVKISAVPPPEEVFKETEKAIQRGCSHRTNVHEQEALAA